LLHPALTEGFGLPPAEALFLGRPILVSDALAHQEIYQEHLQFKRLDADDLAERIEDLRAEGMSLSPANSVFSSRLWSHVAKDIQSRVTTSPSELGN